MENSSLLLVFCYLGIGNWELGIENLLEAPFSGQQLKLRSMKKT